jgi:hypothetical protein
MVTQLACMAEMLTRRPSARKTGTVTKLSQNVAIGVAKLAVPGSGRSRGKSSGHRVWSSGSRETEGVKGPRTVTSEKRTPGSRIRHSKLVGSKSIEQELSVVNWRMERRG